MNIEEKTQQQSSEEPRHNARAGFVPPPRPQPMPKQSDFKNGNKTNKKPKKNKKPEKEKNLAQEGKKETLTKKQKAQIKKWGIIGSAVLVFVLSLTIIISVMVNNAKQNAQLIITQEGGQLSLIKTQGEYFLSAPYQAEADLYFFEIRSDFEEGSEIIEIKTKENLVSVTGTFSTPGNYQTRFAIKKQNRPSTKSKYSDWVLVTSTQKLEAPLFEYDANLKQFTWQEVSNANAYRLIYFENETLKKIEITQFESVDGLITMSLEDLNLGLGMYEFVLIAINTNTDIYIPSDFNARIKVENFEKLEPVESATYRILTAGENIIGELVVDLKEFRSNLKLKINYGDNQSLIINIVEEGLHHIFDLSKYNGLTFDASDTVEISLVSADEFVSESSRKKVSISN